MAAIPLLRPFLPPTPRNHCSTLFAQPLRLNTPSLPPPQSLAHGSSAAKPRRPTSISASYNTNPVTDRLISAASYFLPFFNGLQYGQYLFAQYPRTLGLFLEPLLPLLSFYRSIPYSGFVAFLLLYVGVVRNEKLSRYVRFNAMQALALDVVLAVPAIIQQIFHLGQRGLGGKILKLSNTAIFVSLAACFVYSLVYSILGRTPKLPFVADVAGRQL